MYQKVLLRTLTSERLVPLPLDLLDRRASVTAFEKLNYHESLAEFVAQALASEAPLRDKRQRIQLAAMIKRELRPIQIISPKNSVFTWRKLSELPESAWKSRLDQAQWEALNRKFQEFQGTTETK